MGYCDDRKIKKTATSPLLPLLQIAMGWEDYHLHRFQIYVKDLKRCLVAKNKSPSGSCRIPLSVQKRAGEEADYRLTYHRYRFGFLSIWIFRKSIT